MVEEDYILAFSNSIGVGPKSFLKLLKLYGSAEKAWRQSSPEKFKNAGVGKVFYGKFENFKKEFNIDEYKKKLQKAKVEFIPYGDKFYPESLKSIESSPIGLYVKGNKGLLLNCMYPSPQPSPLGGGSDHHSLSPRERARERGMPVLAVVGSRKITSYGRQVTENLVIELVANNFIIVSGMALGVDGIAHKSAVEQGGSTIAVLGCGVDCPYPRENEKLYEEILDSGGLVISEYPLGMPANQGTFPARNRIVAGLSSSVLITEAAEDSGSLITAELAIKQGKTVFAVPGPITSQMSRGAIKLLKQGAKLVQTADDIFDELKVKGEKGKGKSVIASAAKQSLSKVELKVYECIQNEEKGIDEISRETKIKTSELMSILSGMELSGIVKSFNGKFRV